jgi:hypothetical protein
MKMTPLVALVAIAVFWWDSVDLSFFTTTVSLAASSSSRRCFLSPDVKECWRKELEEIKKGYNRHFMCKKSRAGHVCTAPSDVNDGNGRRG